MAWETGNHILYLSFHRSDLLQVIFIIYLYIRQHILCILMAHTHNSFGEAQRTIFLSAVRTHQGLLNIFVNHYF